MLKKIVFAGLGIALLTSPLLTSADTLTDAQSKIAALLAQLQQLQTQIGQLQGGNAGGGGVGVAVLPSVYPIDPITICPSFRRVLVYGTTGDDVTQLQQYLKQQGIFAASPTGFFGHATEAAVQKWQAANGIVANGDPATTGWGIVGVKTRAWFSKWCGGGGNQNFSASPTSGAAPLAVTFTVTAQAGDYSVEFGDGQSSTVSLPAVQCVRAPCNTAANTSHTYTSNGRYAAKLMYQPSFSCPPGAACPAMMPAPKQVGQVVITVGSRPGNGTSYSVSPTSGNTPLTVTVTNSGSLSAWCNSSGDTIMARPADLGHAYIDFGDGSKVNFPECSSTLQHTYTTNGTYTVSTSVSGGFVAPNYVAPVRYIGTVTVGGTAICEMAYLVCPTGKHHVSGPGSCQQRCDDDGAAGAPAVTGIDGPASLAVGQQGTWTVHASVPSNSQVHYSVVWGDEPQLDQSIALAGFMAPMLNTSGSFTHAYASGGTYMPTFRVSNDAGSSQTSASVVVGGGTWSSCDHVAPPSGCYWQAGASCSLDTLVCTGGNPTFSATPTWGAAPLAVQFSTTEKSGTINFGDGTSGQVQAGPLGVCYFDSTCNGGGYGASHTYTTNGTYTATLMGDNCWADGCTNGYKVLGTVTITVGGNNGGTLSAWPTTGDAPLMVTFSGVGNSIDFGDGSPTLITNGPQAVLGTLTHVYLAQGTYTAQSGNTTVNVNITGNPRKWGTTANIGGVYGTAGPCIYNNRTYASGTSVDVPVRSCGYDRLVPMTYANKMCFGSASPSGITGQGEIVTQHYTCSSGTWTDQYGSGVDPLVNATSCQVLGGMTVADGQMVAQFYGTAAFQMPDIYANRKMSSPLKCVNGAWFQCDASGGNCTTQADAPSVSGYEVPVAASAANPNLANALTALEAALKAILASLGR